MSNIANTEANATSLDGLVNENGLIPTLRNGPKPSWQYIVDQVYAQLGYAVAGSFVDGFTYTGIRQVGADASGNTWIYTGGEQNLPHVVPAGTVPSAPDYFQVSVNSADNVVLDNGENLQQAIDRLNLEADEIPKNRSAIEAVYKAQGYNNVFFFEDGFTYTESNDVGIYEDGTAWTYTDAGALPVTVGAGTVPSKPTYNKLELRKIAINPTGDILEDSSTLLELFSSSSLFVLGGDWVFDNSSTPLSITSGTMVYGNYTVTATTGNTLLLANNAKGFTLGSGRFRGFDENPINGVGSKLALFEDCSGFSVRGTDISISSWDLLYLRRCSGFTVEGSNTNYGKSSGIVLEDCFDYHIINPTSSGNGRYSSDDSLPDIPPSLTSHKGRGVTVFATSLATTDQGNSIIENPVCKNNTEFNIRCFAQESTGNPSVKNLDIINPVVEDAGAPAGTYGTVTTVDKGVDILVNSAISGEAININIKNPRVVRNLTFGNAFSLAGYCSLQGGRSESDAESSLASMAIFSGEPKITGHKVENFGYYFSVGSGSPIVDIRQAEGVSLIAVSQALTSNTTLHGDFKARSAGYSNGLGLNDRTNLDIDVFMDGFNDQITINENTEGVIKAKTINSNSQGLRGFNFIFDPDKLRFLNCQFDLAFPNFLGSIQTVGSASYITQKVYSNAPPSTNQGVWPDGFIIERRSQVTSGGGSLLQYGWRYNLSLDSWQTIQVSIS